jgi:hypothetical protein
MKEQVESYFRLHVLHQIAFQLDPRLKGNETVMSRADRQAVVDKLKHNYYIRWCMNLIQYKCVCILYNCTCTTLHTIHTLYTIHYTVYCKCTVYTVHYSDYTYTTHAICSMVYALYATTCGDGAVTGWGRGQIKICGMRMGTKLLPRGRGGEDFSPRVTLLLLPHNLNTLVLHDLDIRDLQGKNITILPRMYTTEDRI